MRGVAFDLRPLDEAGCAPAADLHRAVFADQPEQCWSAETFRGLLAIPGTAGLLAVPAGSTENRPAALILYRHLFEDAEILTLAVEPGLRRLGAGRLLLRESLRRCATEGATRMSLEVAIDNCAARHLYADAGFIEGGRRANYYRRGDHSIAAIRLTRPLT